MGVRLHKHINWITIWPYLIVEGITFMGTKFFGHSSWGNTEAPNPNPEKFRVWDCEEYGPFVLARINYPGCTTYDGDKICVYKTTAKELKARSEIDPHFLGTAADPIARFPASSYGKMCAKIFCKALMSDSFENTIARL